MRFALLSGPRDAGFRRRRRGGILRRVLVTGGSGFIGSHVVDALLATGVEVRNYDRRPSVYHDASQVEPAFGELIDREAMTAAMAGCDAVIHLAAVADVGEVIESPASSEESNAGGTLTVLEAARAADIGRVVYGSTIWVYGASDDDPVTEDSALGLPKHLYTASKLAGEMYCTSYAGLYGIDYTILRFGIPYGPRARPAAVIPSFVHRGLAGEPLTLAGDGLQTRRFIYVSDLAEGVVRALRPEAANRIYNLAGEQTVTIRELAEVVSDEIGEVEIVHTPGRGGDFGGAEVSSARATEELGWRASTPLREGVRCYLAWLSSEGAPEAVTAPVHAPPVAARESARGRVFASASIAALACAVGTFIPYQLAVRTDDFGRGQSHLVAITTLVAILASLSALPAFAGTVRAWVAGSLVAGYVALLVVPWSRLAFALGMPHLGTLALSAMGTGAALVIAVGARRLQGTAAPAADRAS